MSEFVISILVPVYNSSMYLKKCLNSLKKQTLKELEFILINDGSTDESLDIMKYYQKNDRRFKILDKKNTGYGDSLNLAIKLAKGEYVGIVEPDDFCDEVMFETLLKLAHSYDADIARGNYYDYSDSGVKIVKPLYTKCRDGIINPLEDYGVFYEIPAIWSAIYRKSFLEENKIEFLETQGASYQDAGFHFKTLACAKRVALTGKPLYYYRTDNPNSSVKDYRKIMAIVREYSSIESFIQKQENSQLLMKYCQVAKFGRYHWNLLRLEGEELAKFAGKMKKEFNKKEKGGLLNKKYFPRKYWVSLVLLLKLPIRVYLGLFLLKKRVR